MEVYVNSIGFQNLQDNVTRKYNELLYILSELSSVYYSLDSTLRADVEVQNRFSALQRKLNGLALELKGHKEFLLDAGEEYLSIDRLVERKTCELPNINYFSTSKPGTAIASNTPSIPASVADCELRVFPGTESLITEFTYVPGAAFLGVDYIAKDLGDSLDSVDIIDVSISDVDVKRDYGSYEKAVTLFGIDQNDKPQTTEDYLRAVFDRMAVEYPANLSGAFTEPSQMSDYGWYCTTREDAVSIAGDGYPAVIYGKSGFIGVILNGDENGVFVTACGENGVISVETGSDDLFYVHR